MPKVVGCIDFKPQRFRVNLGNSDIAASLYRAVWHLLNSEPPALGLINISYAEYRFLASGIGLKSRGFDLPLCNAKLPIMHYKPGHYLMVLNRTQIRR